MASLKGFIKGAGKVVGKGLSAASNVLPPGLRQAAAVGGSVLQGKNAGDHLRAAVTSSIPIPGAGAALGGGVKGAVKGAIKAIPGALAKAAMPSTGGWGGGGGAAEVMRTAGAGGVGGGGGPAGGTGGGWGDAIKGALGGAGDLIKKAGGWAMDNPTTVLAGGLAASGAMDAAKASGLRDRAMKDIRGSYDERAGIRGRATQGLMNAQRPDLSSAFANPGDVYATPLRSATPGPSPVARPTGGPAAAPRPAVPPDAAEVGRKLGIQKWRDPALAAAAGAPPVAIPALKRRGQRPTMDMDPTVTRRPARRV